MSVEWGGSYGTSYTEALAALRRVNRKVRLEGDSARSLNGAETGAVGSLLGRLPVPVSTSQETT